MSSENESGFSTSDEDGDYDFTESNLDDVQGDVPLPSNWSQDSRFNQWLAWDNFAEKRVKCTWCNCTLQGRFPSVMRNYRSAKLHTLCVVVHYKDPIFRRIQDSLFEVVSTYKDKNSNATAESTFEKWQAVFEQHNIPMENMICFCSDTCYVMMGAHNSVASRLRELLGEDFLIVSCKCHIGHLCVKHAFEVIPPAISKVISGERFYNCIQTAFLTNPLPTN